MISHPQPPNFIAKIRQVFRRNPNDSSAVNVAPQACNIETERLLSLYESLAMRVAHLESGLQNPIEQGLSPHVDIESMIKQQPKPPPLDQEGGLNIGWFRILRHMLPHKVRRLLVEHDHFERMQSEVSRLHDKLIRERLRKKGLADPGEAVVSKDAPEFPKTIFEATANSKIMIVDVGAQDLVSEEHVYTPLQRAGATSVVGFEPLPGLGSTPRRVDPSVVMLNHFVGAGGQATFHVTQFDPASSLFKPNMELLSQFVNLPPMYETVSTNEVQTTRLDDVTEIGECDYLKIDVQGGELDVLKGAQRLLENAIAIHCEVEFAPVYQDQPLFAEIDMLLQSLGFELIDLVNAGYNRYQALPGDFASGSRLLWAEALYFKTPHLLAKLGAEKLLKAAYFAHVNHAMYDLAARFLSEYDKLKKGSMLSIYSAEMTQWKKRNPE
jgi:FkbM family methyltransferase